MYWGFYGKEINEKSMSDNVNFKLSRFLISRPDYFCFTIDILITFKKRTDNNKIYDLNRIEKRLKAMAIADSSLKGDSDQFLMLLNKYNDSKNNKGKLLDYIIYEIGPYKLNRKRTKRLSECKVAIKGKFCSSKNFDVVFYTFARPHSDALEAEIIECKIDINTFIHSPPRNKESFSDEAQKKCEVMNIIKQKKRELDTIFFYFATCRKNVFSCQQILKEKGYGFIKILGHNDLCKILERYRKQ